jgi:hypothetical protein
MLPGTAQFKRKAFPTFFLMACSIVGICTVGHSQSRTQLKVPEDFLATLDEEDRQCVTSNGVIAKQVRVLPIQLATDKSRQLLIRGSGLCLCGAQNCGFWVYRKSGSRQELILKGAGSTRVRTGPGTAKGFREIIAESHASAIETWIRTYRFDGRQYQLHRCVRQTFYDDNGNPTKQPIARRCT